MRFLFVVLAGAIGWLWYAARAPADPPPPPSQIRHADLAGLGAQVAAAREVVPAYIEREVELETDDEPDEPELEVDDESEPDLADLAEQAQLAVYDRPPPADAIDVSEQFEYQEFIVIEGSAPIIDQTEVTHCGVGIDVEYTKNIPIPARTFGSVIGAAADTFDGESISSGDQIENTYYVNGDAPAVDQPAVDQPAEIPNEFLEEIQVIGGTPPT